MDTKQAYSALIAGLQRQLDAELPLAKEADDTLVAKRLLSHPSEAAQLFTSPIDGYEEQIFKEVATEAHKGNRYTDALYQSDDEAALCDAIAAHADLYLTADLKYHDFQRGEDRIILADAGHYETEQFAKEIISRAISEKFCNFACRISERQLSIVHYI